MLPVDGIHLDRAGGGARLHALATAQGHMCDRLRVLQAHSGQRYLSTGVLLGMSIDPPKAQFEQSTRTR
jgi:hypothetical protein